MRTKVRTQRMRIHTNILPTLRQMSNSNSSCIWSIYLSVDPIFQSLWFLLEIYLLTRKPLNQGFLLVKLKSSLRSFYGRHHDLVNRYGVSVSQMTTDMFHLSLALPILSSFMTYHLRSVVELVIKLII